MKYQFVLSVWGRHYLELLSTVVLPSLMTAGNLLGFRDFESEFDIYTTAESKRSLESMPGLRALAEIMEIRITTVPGNDNEVDNKYSRMNDAHRLATLRSAQIDSILFFLSPDAVHADGSLVFARLLIERGKRAVFLNGERSAAEPMIADLKHYYTHADALSLRISPRELATLLIRHPHACHDSQVWGNTPFITFPGHIFFPVADEGYILRGFFHQPLAVHPRDRSSLPTSTVDGCWLAESLPLREDWHLITDTDDAFVVDVGTQPDSCSISIDHADPERFVAEWMGAFTDPGHHWMAKQNVYVHNCDRSPRWTDAELLAKTTLNRIFELYERPLRSIVTLAAQYKGRGAAPLALFGAADLADRVVREITAAGASIAGIFDNDSRKHGLPYGTLLVQPPNAIRTVDSSGIVILVRRSQAQAQADIRRTIEQTGYRGQIIPWGDL